MVRKEGSGSARIEGRTRSGQGRSRSIGSEVVTATAERLLGIIVIELFAESGAPSAVTQKTRIDGLHLARVILVLLRVAQRHQGDTQQSIPTSLQSVVELISVNGRCRDAGRERGKGNMGDLLQHVVRVDVITV